MVTKEISIGDYVLSGGEIPAAVFCDTIIRLIPGVLNDETSALSDSFQDDLLAPPVYTRPSSFNGWEVPKVLTSGNLKEIEKCVKSETEKTCISAIQTVFKNIDDLDFLNKRAILIYVRDISGLTPKQLSVAMSSIRKHYRRLTKGEEKFNLFF